MQRTSWIADSPLVFEESVCLKKFVKDLEEQTCTIHVLVREFTAHNTWNTLCYTVAVCDVWRTPTNTHKKRYSEYITSSGVTAGRDRCPTCRPHPLSGLEVDTWSKPLADIVSDISTLVPDKIYEDRGVGRTIHKEPRRGSYLICVITLVTKIFYSQIRLNSVFTVHNTVLLASEDVIAPHLCQCLCTTTVMFMVSVCCKNWLYGALFLKYWWQSNCL